MEKHRNALFQTEREPTYDPVLGIEKLGLITMCTVTLIRSDAWLGLRRSDVACGLPQNLSRGPGVSALGVERKIGIGAAH